ncbi:MAG: ATP-binding cassette domain-containing protein [bacterium]|nr:ATP-binding cassette domain-containing protein [bacterium]MDE0669268.1 ATP-binding cassette domain-containing protein [bacterium]
MQPGSSDSPLLDVRQLSAGYGHVQVLFGVNLCLAAGETVALLGANGAGKTTLLRTLGGLLSPTEGSIRLAGRTITSAGPETRFRLGVVQLRGGEGTFAPLSVGDNLAAALLGASSLRREEHRQRREEVLALFPALAERLDDPARDLSGGQRQMLALAMVLQHRPELLLIDELSLGLAPIVVQELLGALALLRAQGRTMLIVEQSVSLALDFADRAMFLERGRLVFEGRTEELRQRPDLLRAAFLGDAEQSPTSTTAGAEA